MTKTNKIKDDIRAPLERVLRNYARLAGTDLSCAIRDVLTELMHVCDRERLDFDCRLEAARQVRQQELLEDEQQEHSLQELPPRGLRILNLAIKLVSGRPFCLSTDAHGDGNPRIHRLIDIPEGVDLDDLARSVIILEEARERRKTTGEESKGPMEDEALDAIVDFARAVVESMKKSGPGC